MNVSPIPVLIAEDNQLVRESLVELFSNNPETRVVCVASSGEQALEMALELKPSLVFTSTTLSDIDGVTLAIRLREKLPQVRIIAVSVNGDLQTLRQLKKDEVCWFIRKNVTLQEWFQGVLMGGTCAENNVNQCPESCLSNAKDSIRDILDDRIAQIERSYFEALLQHRGKVNLSSWLERLKLSKAQNSEQDEA